MNSTSIRGTLLAAFFAAMFLLSVVPSEAKVVKAACSVKKGINAAILKLKPGDILVVTGTCNENVVIPQHISGITIDGQNSTTINGIDPAETTLTNRGANNTIKNLTITGGQTGIQIQRSSSATIDTLVINGVGGSGILVSGSSTARIINSTITNNVNGSGISISENSNARIGFLTNNDTTASGNTITGNNRGIVVSEASNAVIVGNVISNNTLEGILVNTVSHADIASNTIDANGNNGVHFGRNSGVDLGADTGTSIFELPNSTTPGSANVGFGIRCFINSYVDRRAGTLNGTLGQKEILSGCVDSLL
jgi:parallel beta-helix repeat protein